MKRKKVAGKLTAVVLAAVLAVSEVPMYASAEPAEINADTQEEFTADADEAMAEDSTAMSGTCGENLTWVYDGAGKLMISGSGEMEDYSYNNPAPWDAYRNSIKNIELPDELTGIGDYTFYYCNGLTEIVIPEGVTSIGNSAFYGCRGLTGIDIPEGVTSIGNSAFEYCSGLTGIDIPGGVTSIGERAFFYCEDLTGIVIIPEGVTSIGQYTFAVCRGLTGIVIPKGVTSIGNSAFGFCSGLTSITIPDGVTSIDDYAFYCCSGLTGIDIPDGVTGIGDYAFAGCSGMRCIAMPKGVTGIGDYAFRGCISLTDVYYSGTEEQWKSITIGSNNAYLASATIHYNAVGLPSEIPDIKPVSGICGENLTWVYDGAGKLTVSGTGEMENFSETDDLVPWYIYRESIENIELPSGLTSIGQYAFANCSSLTNIVIPNGVTKIFFSAFQDCSSLTNIVISEGVTRIGGAAFNNCSRLTDVYYSGTEEQWKYVSIEYGNECLTSATIHYNAAEIPTPSPDATVESFMERVYEHVFNREIDPAGFDYWVSKLADGGFDGTGVFVGYSFIFSDEFKDRGYSDKEFIDILYLTFLGRDADASGEEYWISNLEGGFGREYVFTCFMNTDEYRKICDDAGITFGNPYDYSEIKEACEAYRNQNGNISKYVTRCYTKVLGRAFEDDGVEFWCGQIITGNCKAVDAARAFVFSDEFKNKNKQDNEYIEVLYQMFFDRAGDEAGIDYWLSQLASGAKTRETILDDFSYSNEFAGVLAGFGL